MIINYVSVSPQTTTPSSTVTISVGFQAGTSWGSVRDSYPSWQAVKTLAPNWGFNNSTWNTIKSYASWAAVAALDSWQVLAFGDDNVAIQQVRAQINGVWTALTYNSATGKYTGTIAAPAVTSYNVNSGHYYPVTIEAKNKAGTISTANDTSSTIGTSLRLKVKEITKPSIAITAPTSGAYLGTNVPAITVQVRDEASGSGINISTFRLTVDGTAYASTASGMAVTAVTNGYNVTYTPPAALADGVHTIKVDVSDYDGNAAPQATRSFTTDTVPPTLSISNPASNDLWVAVAGYTVTGTTNDSLSGLASLTIKLNGTDQGTVTVAANGTFSKSITLAEGVNTIVVTATDKANKTTTVTRTINLDTSTPVITAVTISPNPVNVNSSYTVTVEVDG